MLSSYGKRECLIIIGSAVVLIAAALLLQWWIMAGLMVLATVALLAFFRDPHRRIPSQRGVMVSPADGRVSSIHRVEPIYEPLGEPATCVRIFLSVLDVHVNRSPCHGRVTLIRHKPGQFLNALNPQSAEVNEANLLVFEHPTRKERIAAVNQIAGAIARRIVCGVKVGQILQRGERFGMIKFGSTTELYIPDSLQPRVEVQQGQYVYGGTTVLARVRVTAEGTRTET